MAAQIRLLFALLALVFLAGQVSAEGKPPRITIKPKREYHVQVGSKVRLKCVATGMKDPEDNRTHIGWKKLGEGVITAQGNPRYKSHRRGLKIVNAQPWDSGRYMCVAYNSNGFENVTANVIVRGKPTIPERNAFKKVSSDRPRSLPISILSPSPKSESGRPPEFMGVNLGHRMVISQISGSSVKLKCRATGRPAPKITWHKNKKRLSRAKRRQHLTGKGWILAFDHVLVRDAGRYMCRVRNKHGVISRIFDLRVAHDNTPITKPGKDLAIQIALDNVTVNEGNNATFVCNVIGAKQPEHVSWLKINWNISAAAAKNSRDYQLITQTNHTRRQKLVTDKPVTLPGTRKLSFNNRLVLMHVTKDDEGMYTCTVGTKGNFRSSHAYLVVHGKPKKRIDESRTDRMEIRGEIPMAAFIGVPLAVAAVLIASLVWCFVQTRKSKKRSFFEPPVATLDTKISCEMKSVTFEKQRECTEPVVEQPHMRNGKVIFKCDSKALSKCEKQSNNEDHDSLTLHHYEANACLETTQGKNDHELNAENKFRDKSNQMQNFCDQVHTYEPPNIQTLNSETTGHLFRFRPCCQTKSCSCQSSLSDSATIQSVV